MRVARYKSRRLILAILARETRCILFGSLLGGVRAALDPIALVALIVVGSVVKQELSPYFRDGEMRTWIDGPPAMLKPDLAQAIAVALHELATNAAKFGALSVAKGQVRVEWSRAADGRLVLRWIEAGGSPVNPPTRKGFGTHVMEAMIRGQVGGDVRLDWHAEGLVCEIVLPM
jgi:two-component sensor histidine kinase